MASLTGTKVSDTYQQLLKLTSQGVDADASAKYIEDGLGIDTALSLSTTRVGIGTDSPGYQLDLRRNDTGTATSLGIRQIGTGDASMAFQTSTSPYGFCIGVDGSDSDAFKIATGTDDIGTNTKLTITTDGKVGIGTANIDELMHIESSSSGKPVLQLENTNTNANPSYLKFYKNSTSPADDDYLGALIFRGNTDNGSGAVSSSDVEFASIQVLSDDTGNSDKSSKILIKTFTGNTESTNMTIGKDGNVGIGTEGPGAMLHTAHSSSTAYNGGAEILESAIIQNTNGSDGSGVNNVASLGLQVASGATSQGFINYVRTGDNTGDFTFSQRTGSSSYAEHMRITSAGKGHFKDEFAVGTGVSSGYAVLGLISEETGSTRYGSIRKNYDSPFDFRVRASNSDSEAPLVFDGSSDTEYARFDTNGSLGINTSAPTAMVDIANTANNEFPLKIRGNIDNSGGFTGIKFGYEADTGSYEKAAIKIEGTTGNVQPNFHVLLNDDANSADVSADNTDARLSVYNAGYVTVGGSTTQNVNLTVNGSSGSARVVPQTDDTGYIGQSSLRWQALYATNGTIQTSDKKLKTSITSTDLGLDFINKLNPVSYKWIIGGYDITEATLDEKTRLEKTKRIETPVSGKRKHYGLIAQEVKEVLGGNDFGGWVKEDLEDDDSLESLRYDQFIAPLIKAVQELSVKIEALESKVEELEPAEQDDGPVNSVKERVNSLEARVNDLENG